MPLPGIGIGAFLAGLIARYFAADLVKFFAMKTILFSLMVFVLPVILNNVLHSLVVTSATLVGESAASGGFASPLVANVTGFAAWLLTALKMPQVVSVLMGGLAFRVAVGFIPFYKR